MLQWHLAILGRAEARMLYFHAAVTLTGKRANGTVSVIVEVRNECRIKGSTPGATN